MPFDTELLELPIPQLDWILAMYAKDNPKEIKLVLRNPDGTVRETMDGNRAWIKSRKAWDEVLRGKALDKHQGRAQIAPIREAIEKMRAQGKLRGMGVPMPQPTVQAFGPDGKPIKTPE
jgi:hypothetical protein